MKKKKKQNRGISATRTDSSTPPFTYKVATLTHTLMHWHDTWPAAVCVSNYDSYSSYNNYD